MNKRQKRLRSVVFISCIFTLLYVLAFSGCANIRFIADYDEKTDTSVTQFRHNTDIFLTFLERNVGTDEAKYENNTRFYDDAKVTLRDIRSRAQAIPKNEITIKQVDLLVENVGKLEQLHRLGITVDDIALLRSSFDISCTAILKLELAKKRNESQVKNSK